MNLTPAGLALIKRWEHLELAAYQDIAGVWTIGWGHTRFTQHGMLITEERADELLRLDLAATYAAVQNVVGLNTSDEQFSAMVSLAFNIGCASSNFGFRASTVLKAHRMGLFQQAADAFLLWDRAHVDGKQVVVSGLASRRRDERSLSLTEDGAGSVS
jgi:lysozyme